MVIRPDLKYSNDSVILMVTVKSSLLIWNNAKWTLQLRHETTARTYCVVVTSSGRGGGVGRFWSCHDELYPIIPQGSMIHPHWQLTVYPPPPPKTMWSPQGINNDCSLKERGETSFAIKNAEAWVLFHRQWHQSLPGPTITLHCYSYVITSDWLKNSYWKTTLIFLEKFLASKFICPCSLIVL